MRNIEMKVVGTKLVITCDLEGPQTPSSTGKTMIIASTEGNKSVPGHESIKLGLNLYTK